MAWGPWQLLLRSSSVSTRAWRVDIWERGQEISLDAAVDTSTPCGRPTSRAFNQPVVHTVSALPEYPAPGRKLS